MPANTLRPHPCPQGRPQPAAAGALTSAAAQRVDSRQLLAPGQTTLTIDHAGQCYLLRVTRENKLILTK